MKRVRLLYCLVALLVCSMLPAPYAATPRTHASLSTPISHIVFIVKENHTFDSLFGSFAGVNGATTGVVKVNGVDQTIPLNPGQNVMANYCHEWKCAKTAYDSGAMDAFNLADPTHCGTSPYICYQTGTATLIPNYWTLAQNYVLDDNGWSSLRSASFPNHLYTVAAASGPDIPHSVIHNPHTVTPHTWGCDSGSGSYVGLYNGTTTFPCFSYTTLMDEMQAAGVPWKYYAPHDASDGGYVWNTADAFSAIRNTSLWTSNDVPWQTFATDAAAGNLPAFSWLTPPIAASEHNNYLECQGENWTIQQINAVMNGPNWASTAIVVTWDDWGGLYDHVAPQQVDALGYGFRVPFLVISPYAYAGDNPANPHVSHDQLELSSVLRFAEEVLNLPSLGKRDATAGSLLPLFDFSKKVHHPPLPLMTRTCPTGHVTPVQNIDD